MCVGLATIRPGKLRTLFPDMGFPQFRLAQRLYKRLGRAWIVESRDAYGTDGYPGVAKIAGSQQRTVIEALMIRLSSLPQELFPPSEYNFIDNVIENLRKGITCLVDISGISSDEQRRITCLTASSVALHYKWMWEGNYEAWKKLPTLLITLEEAHEFLDPNLPKQYFLTLP